MRGPTAAFSVFQSFGVRVALLAVNVATGIIVARTLAAAGRGEQAAMSLWPPLIAGLVTLGIPTALNFHARRLPAKSGGLLFAAGSAAMALGFVAAAVAAIALPSLLRGYGEPVIVEARWLLLFIPQCLLTYVLRAYLESVGEFARSNLSQLVPASFTLIGLVALAATHHLTSATAPLAYLVPGAVQTVWLLARLWPRVAIVLGSVAADMRMLFAYGFRAYGIDIIGALSTQIDQALIIAFLSPRSLGLYAVALSASRVVTIPHQSITMVLFPRAAGLPPGVAAYLIARIARLSNGASIVLGMGFIALLPIVIPLVYGRAFSEAIPIAQLLTVEALLGGTTSVLSLAFPATGRPFALTLIEVVWISTSALTLVGLVPRMGIEGAALALVVSATVRLALVLIVYHRILDVKIARFLPDTGDVMYLFGKFRDALRSRGPLLAEEQRR
jgi:enterobacterial common antigen flippase